MEGSDDGEGTRNPEQHALSDATRKLIEAVRLSEQPTAFAMLNVDDLNDNYFNRIRTPIPSTSFVRRRCSLCAFPFSFHPP